MRKHGLLVPKILNLSLQRQDGYHFPHPFYAPYTHLMPSVSQDTGLRWSKLLPVIKDAYSSPIKYTFPRSPAEYSNPCSALYSAEQICQDHLGSLLNADPQAPLNGLKKPLWRAVPENLHCNELPSQFSCTWLYRFKYSKGLGLDQCTSVFPASSHRRNMFTFCSYTHIRICQGNRNFVKLYCWCMLHFEFSILFLIFFQRLIITH